MRSLLILITAVALLFTAACASNLSREKQGRTMERAEVENKVGRRYHMNTYDYMHDDGRFGVRNAGPNVESTDWAQPTDMDDKTRIKKSVLRINGVKNAEVSILGGHAAIRVIPQPDVPASEYERLQEIVLRRISFEMPRYEIRVRVGWNKWDPRSYIPGNGR